MPVYHCIGAACRLRNARSFLHTKVTGAQPIFLAKLIVARSESAAKDIFWNEHFHPLLLGIRASGLQIRIREIPPEELQAMLTQSLLQPV